MLAVSTIIYWSGRRGWSLAMSMAQKISLGRCLGRAIIVFRMHMRMTNIDTLLLGCSWSLASQAVSHDTLVASSSLLQYLADDLYDLTQIPNTLFFIQSIPLPRCRTSSPFAFLLLRRVFLRPTNCSCSRSSSNRLPP